MRTRAILFLAASLFACTGGQDRDAGSDATTADVADSHAIDGDRGETDAPSPDAGPTLSLPAVTGEGTFALPGRTESHIEVVVPASRTAHPPLLLAFHGTGGEPMDMIVDYDLIARAEALGFVAIAPRAGYRDTPHPADVDHTTDSGGSSWNMWTASPDANEDLRYLRALIASAHATWGADTTRVYTLGFSNGAFFAYFVAASLPDEIAGFAENSGGWTSDACPTRYDASDATQYVMSTSAPAGADMTCAQIFADPAFPAACHVTASNHLRPPPTPRRVPLGFLGHYAGDDTVSVVWSCLLAESLGPTRARTRIRSIEVDGVTGHSPIAGFVDEAFAFFAGRTSAD